MSATHYTVPLREAVVKLMDQATGIDSSLAAYISRFIRLVSTPMAKHDRGVQDMPHSLQEQKKSGERRCSYSRYGEVVLYHLMKAVMGFYRLVDDRGRLEDEAHIRRLLHITNLGLNFYRVAGDAKLGYHLLTETEAARPGFDPIADQIHTIRHERSGDDEPVKAEEVLEVRGTETGPVPPTVVEQKSVPSRGRRLPR